MKRVATQIYLTPEQHAALQSIAERTGCSMTEVIRSLIDTHVVQGGPPPTDISDLAASISVGRPTNVAIERDAMLAEALSAVR